MGTRHKNHRRHLKFKVVCDTSVLIAFDTLEKTEILFEIFFDIIVPEGVYNELTIDQMGFVLEERIIVKKIANIDLYKSLCLKLDEGESESRTWNKEIELFC